MSPRLSLLLLTAVALWLPDVAGAESLPRRESNVSIRHEVQIAIDKGLARLQSTQRADGTWGRLGVTGFALMALQRHPREEGEPSGKRPALEATIEKACDALRRAFSEQADLQKTEDFAWNVPPAVLAVSHSRSARDLELVARARQAIGAAPLPEAPETRALFLALDPGNRKPGAMPAPVTGSALSAWTWMNLQHVSKAGDDAQSSARPAETLISWLRDHYSLEENPGGEGVHQYYFWLSSVLGESLLRPVTPELKLSNGQTIDIPRQLAERLINKQNGNGSWSGVGEHWTEKDPDLVTSYCLLTLEAIYGLL